MTNETVGFAFDPKRRNKLPSSHPNSKRRASSWRISTCSNFVTCEECWKTREDFLKVAPCSLVTPLHLSSLSCLGPHPHYAAYIPLLPSTQTTNRQANTTLSPLLSPRRVKASHAVHTILDGWGWQHQQQPPCPPRSRDANPGQPFRRLRFLPIPT